jgi:hypothetical protein
MQLRTEFVLLAEQGGNIRQLCRRFEIRVVSLHVV